MGKLRGLFAICMLLLFTSAHMNAESESDKAKKKLEKLGKELSPEEFLDSMDDDEYEAAEAYLKAGMSVNTRDKRGNTALHNSADSGQIRVVSLLIKAGADVNAKNEDGDTPIFKAAQFGHDEAINVLLRAGADPNLANEGGETPLMKAAIVGYFQTVRLLIQAGADIHAADEQGNTPLICAASLNRKSMMSLKIPEQNFVTIIQDLAKAGADVNAKRKYHGETALIEAADQGHTEIVKALLAAGADVNTKTKVDELTALFNASRHGHSEIAKLLIAAGADVNAKDRIGRNAAAFAKDYPEILQLLKSTGSEIPKTTAKSMKTTKLNVSSEEKDAAKNLLEARGINFTEDMFMHYVKDGDIDVVDMFLTAGMNPDVKDDRDGTTTALIYAGMMKRNEVALALIKAGADVDAMDMNGSTTLIWIANHCDQSELVEALIKNGANVNAKAAGGATPLMMAGLSNCTKNAQLLKKAGAK